MYAYLPIKAHTRMTHSQNPPTTQYPPAHASLPPSLPPSLPRSLARSLAPRLQLQGVEARTKLQNAAVRRTPERQVHQQSGSAAGSGHRLLETDGPPADVGKRWLVDGCPQQTTGLDVEPALADADQSLGEVQCCTAEFTATRVGCLSGSNTAAKVTFWEARALCEGRGWRLCRREEIDTGNGGGACGTGCGYDSTKLWAELNSPAPQRWLVDGTDTFNTTKPIRDPSEKCMMTEL